MKEAKHGSHPVPPEAEEDYRKYLQHMAALSEDLRAGRIHVTDYERRKAEA
jgi:hypothetical protein